MSLRSRSFVLLLSVVVLMSLGACGSDTGQSTKLGPYRLVSRAASKTISAESARVSMESRISGPTDLTMTGTGVVDLTGKRGSMTMMFQDPSEGSLQLEIVFDDLVVYEKFPPELAAELPEGKSWVKVDLGALSKEAGFDFGEIMASSPSDPTQALHFLLGASRDVRDLGKEVIRGVATSHYRLTLDLRKAARQVPDSAQESYDTLLDMLESPLIPAEVWIDDEGRLRKMTFTETIASGPGAAEGDVTVEMTMEYYDFGVAVDVELPPESEVVDILEILQETPSA